MRHQVWVIICVGCGGDFHYDAFGVSGQADGGGSAAFYAGGSSGDGVPVNDSGAFAVGGADGSAGSTAGSGGAGRFDGGIGGSSGESTGGEGALDDAGASEDAAGEPDAVCGGNSCPGCTAGLWHCCTLSGACGCAWSSAPTAQCF